ncbi:putative membrane protein YhdT [Gracilibacillus halotolerans]|uniref:Putative membrane protein YhdT n=1 Tax=Gracilibacillus halotolerans TaxID=74386 RepID=A0A841RQQ0_9BACI|nr:YhdT family protein [Gracilibacillus halotolerans]MBB6513254.1 putative membrane protein YhdT [Gracilibacillus halotolerans]
MPPTQKLQASDRRYTIANREALFGISLVVFHFLWWFGFAYGLGSKEVDEYTYILGFPAWFFYSCIIGFILISLLVFIIVKKFFVNIPLDEEESDI